MRLAVVSDVHGSLEALEAVIADIERSGVDEVVHGGDLVLMGPQPAEAIDRIRELGWRGVVGNTDEVLWRPEEHERQLRKRPKLRSLLALMCEEWGPPTRDLLGDERVALLRDLPATLEVAGVLLMHASPDDLWRAPLPDASDDELDATYRETGADRIVYGHIHRPYTRDTGTLAVGNSGSAGFTWDGDPRASYLLMEPARMEVVRVEYDSEADARRLIEMGYPDAERLAEIRRRRELLPGPLRATRGGGRATRRRRTALRALDGEGARRLRRVELGRRVGERHQFRGGCGVAPLPRLERPGHVERVRVPVPRVALEADAHG